MDEKIILINASIREEIRLAILNKKDNRLLDLDIERPGSQKKANIYKGLITRIEKSLDAVFVDYGAKRHGFLPFKEIAPEYYSSAIGRGEGEPTKSDISQLLREGQEVLVQVDKEERGTKGAALSTYITLAGCYLVLLPNNPHAGGISRRIEGEERGDIRDVLASLELPETMSIIVRTAGMGKDSEDLRWDLSVLLRQWEAILSSYQVHQAPCLLFKESDIVVRTVRDYLRSDISAIIIDDTETFERTRRYIELVRPEYRDRIFCYQDRYPLFQRYPIEKQIETVYFRQVALPSGGSIVLDRTEALLSIDVNSASATSGGDIEATALQTNKEAAFEIARQLRLRDLGGLVVIDFIDMNSTKHQREVEQVLREATASDRARIQMGHISARFGMLELSRQRLRPAISEHALVTCHHCSGQGVLRSPESFALAMLRKIQEEAQRSAHPSMLHIQLPVAVATYLLNERRHSIGELEERYPVKIFVIPHPHLDIPDVKIQSTRRDEAFPKTPSYAQVKRAEPEKINPSLHAAPPVEHALVQPVIEANPKAQQAPESFLRRLLKKWFSTEAESASPPASGKVAPATPHPLDRNRGTRHGTRRRDHASSTHSGGRRNRPHSASRSGARNLEGSESTEGHRSARRTPGPRNTPASGASAIAREHSPRKRSGSPLPSSSSSLPETTSADPTLLLPTPEPVEHLPVLAQAPVLEASAHSEHSSEATSDVSASSSAERTPRRRRNNFARHRQRRRPPSPSSGQESALISEPVQTKAPSAPQASSIPEAD